MLLLHPSANERHVLGDAGEFVVYRLLVLLQLVRCLARLLIERGPGSCDGHNRDKERDPFFCRQPHRDLLVAVECRHLATFPALMILSLRLLSATLPSPSKPIAVTAALMRPGVVIPPVAADVATPVASLTNSARTASCLSRSSYPASIAALCDSMRAFTSAIAFSMAA